MEEKGVSEYFIIQWQLHSERSKVHVHLLSARIFSQLPASGHLTDVWPNPSINPTTTGHFPARIATPTVCFVLGEGSPAQFGTDKLLFKYIQLKRISLTIFHILPDLLFVITPYTFWREMKTWTVFKNANVKTPKACAILIRLSHSNLIQSQALAHKHTSTTEICRCCRMRRNLHNTQKLIPCLLLFFSSEMMEMFVAVVLNAA